VYTIAVQPGLAVGRNADEIKGNRAVRSNIVKEREGGANLIKASAAVLLWMIAVISVTLYASRSKEKDQSPTPS
jgi:hypothetical protein